MTFADSFRFIFITSLRQRLCCLYFTGRETEAQDHTAPESVRVIARLLKKVAFLLLANPLYVG